MDKTFIEHSVESIPMDNVFIEMFGVYADSIYKYIGFGFNWEVDRHPEEYLLDEKAGENKKSLIAGLILDKFQRADSPFYE